MPQAGLSLNQLFEEAERQANRLTVSNEPLPGWSNLTASPAKPTTFRAKENVPERDLRDMEPAEREKVEAYVRGNLVARIAGEMHDAGLLTFGADKDPLGRQRTFWAEVTTSGVVVQAQAAPPPPEPKQPSQMLLAAERSAGVDAGRRDALAEVGKALAEVEAALVPGADPAFILVLLRDKLGLDA